MTVAIIILALIALIILGVARAIHNYNAPKVDQEINDRRQNWFNFRLARRKK